MSEPVGEITDDIKRFCADLSETMLTRDGVGLAAPQVGRLQRIFVLNDEGPRIFINPRIGRADGDLVEDSEGCLSFPGIFIKVKRSPSVIVVATDIEGRTFNVEYYGLLARAVQHEIEHLDGRLLSDHMSYLKRQMVLKKLKKLSDRW